MADPVPSAVLQEAYGEGVSARTIARLVRALGMRGSSQGQVSLLDGETAQVRGFLVRPLAGAWPDLQLDATYGKLRAVGRSFPVAAWDTIAGPMDDLLLR